jgi:hypothetical protein
MLALRNNDTSEVSNVFFSALMGSGFEEEVATIPIQNEIKVLDPIQQVSNPTTNTYKRQDD